jgi:hypothetical protein
VQLGELSGLRHAIPDPDAEIDEIRVRAKKEGPAIARLQPD